MERHLVDVHGFSQGQTAEYKAQKKSRRITASGKPIHNCDYCDATFNSSHCELAEHAHQEHAEDVDEFVVETISFQNLQDYQVGVIWQFAYRLYFSQVGFLQELEASLRGGGCDKPFRSKNENYGTHQSHPFALPLRFSLSFGSGENEEVCGALHGLYECDIDGVTVEHCFNHLGYKARPSQLRLEKSVEQCIVSLLRDGLTVRQVYKKKISTEVIFRNIASKCRVEPGRLHNLDTVSIQIPARDASGDGFVLVVINPTQREWLREYGQRALCVDDTFNLISYSLRLATVIVADERDRALPAAYLLSYR
ncbi:hypothetical protein RB195_010087 [Necator americanus]|uniref:C2H2-type domain-containing protein n=1 Tax=Necator americanus TaxID=51031 RepID=A0ABR1CX20_NECAM